MPDGVKVIKGVVHVELEVLGRDLVRDVDGLSQVVGDDDLAVVLDGRGGDLRARKGLQLTVDFGGHLLREFHAVGDEHGAGVFVMFRLGEQVRRHVARVALRVGHTEDFGGTGDHVDGHDTEHLLLGLRDERVAGADDLVDLRDGLGAVRECRDGLGAADFEDAVDTGHFCGRQDIGVHFAVRSRRGRDDEFADAGDLRGDRVHEDGGRVGGGAAGYVETGLVHGDDFLSHDDAVFVVDDKAVAQLFFVEFRNVGRGPFEDPAEVADDVKSLVDLRFGDLEGREFGFIEFPAVLEEGCIAPRPDIGNDVRDDVLDAGLHIRTGKDLVVRDLAIPVDLHHCSSTCFFRDATRSSICSVLNWKLDLLAMSRAEIGKMSS